MSVPLELRSWQSAFLRDVGTHPRDDYLLVACPAAGKTIAAAAAAAAVMRERGCDQLVVVCPTVVVRDQWAHVLGELGYQMQTEFRDAWPEWIHGVCATYAQVALRADRYASAIARRATVAVFDEIHHAGENLAWGEAIAAAFTGARMRLMLSGTPFRSDRDRIPFLRYAADGTCVPDFAYDYPRAVRDGVCRAVEFRAHDGLITWLDDGQPCTASFSDRLAPAERARRLRASLDPGKPYLGTLLADAHADLRALRTEVRDAAGLVVCDSQVHALEIDRLLTEITGQAPVLAISDIPRAHHAIASFAHEEIEWLVSVRMVAEGVDIPRLGVIAWATTTRTELMVRQVAGRALRGRGEYAALPAIVHMPADPDLVRYAARMDRLGGTARGARRGTSGHHVPPSSRGWDRATRAVDAIPTSEAPAAITPPAPTGRLHGAPETVEISTPQLPPSPATLADRARAREAARGELFALLNVYAQLRRAIEPGYQFVAAHGELTRALGGVRITADSPDELVDEALAWVRAQASELAAQHPDEVKQLARTRRRLAAA
jgi:DNA or RNA helicases of superfamily II